MNTNLLISFIEAIGLNRVRIESNHYLVQDSLTYFAKTCVAPVRLAHVVFGDRWTYDRYQERFKPHLCESGWYVAAPIFEALRIEPYGEAEVPREATMTRELIYTMRAITARQAGHE